MEQKLNKCSEKGLKLFEAITYLDEYYLTNAEIATLQTHANAIAARLPENARLVELGSGYAFARECAP